LFGAWWGSLFGFRVGQASKDARGRLFDGREQVDGFLLATFQPFG
jgi:hypothetical protein